MSTSQIPQRLSRSTGPTDFHLFPRLAPELRLKIWREACSPRTVTIRYSLEQDRCICASKPPAILHTSHESRTEALKTYKLCFGTPSHPAHIYFSPYRDTLYLPRHREMGYDETLRDFKTLVEDREGVLNEIRHVAIEHVDPGVKRPWEPYNKASVLRNFPKLQEVTLVLCNSKGQETVDLDEEVEFVPPKEDPGKLLRLWVDFRQNFVMEERMLENVSRELGKEYKRFTLPRVQIKTKVRRIDGGHPPLKCDHGMQRSNNTPNPALWSIEYYGVLFMVDLYGMIHLAIPRPRWDPSVYSRTNHTSEFPSMRLNCPDYQPKCVKWLEESADDAETFVRIITGNKEGYSSPHFVEFEDSVGMEIRWNYLLDEIGKGVIKQLE
ncbi:uncharacterized protein BP5553_04319 [Venustampulla echinocandica]|uniref:2EXR domain-containing protein n=1 Tax=Venustampulla echinocandica TaxID=2656787 RepID=A0A370TWT2_9HELO|nr:uncharacterized protein BP5553_04319 [Venustampulla echinocandica]RDL39979.1 hypothetical protein BP5553_04319 [Venustampulla echinocandica]